jgi:hypothetical protein
LRNQLFQVVELSRTEKLLLGLAGKAGLFRLKKIFLLAMITASYWNF